MSADPGKLNLESDAAAEARRVACFEIQSVPTLDVVGNFVKAIGTFREVARVCDTEDRPFSNPQKSPRFEEWLTKASPMPNVTPTNYVRALKTFYNIIEITNGLRANDSSTLLAPTGSGNTLIVPYVCFKDHEKKVPKPSSFKMVICCPTIEQTSNIARTMIKKYYKNSGLVIGYGHGSDVPMQIPTEVRTSLTEDEEGGLKTEVEFNPMYIPDNCNCLVLTPALFLAALRSGACFDYVVFDELHAANFEVVAGMAEVRENLYQSVNCNVARRFGKALFISATLSERYQRRLCDYIGGQGVIHGEINLYRSVTRPHRVPIVYWNELFSLSYRNREDLEPWMKKVVEAVHENLEEVEGGSAERGIPRKPFHSPLTQNDTPLDSELSSRMAAAAAGAVHAAINNFGEEDVYIMCFCSGREITSVARRACYRHPSNNNPTDRRCFVYRVVSKNRDDYKMETTGRYKLVLCTNNMESGVTLPNTRVVIDCCAMKIPDGYSASGIVNLVPVWCDSKSKEQRQGRGGRDCSTLYISLLSRRDSRHVDEGEREEWKVQQSFDQKSYVKCFQYRESLFIKPKGNFVKQISKELCATGLADPNEGNSNGVFVGAEPSDLAAHLANVFGVELRMALSLVMAWDGGIYAPMIWAVASELTNYTLFIRVDRGAEDRQRVSRNEDSFYINPAAFLNQMAPDFQSDYLLAGMFAYQMHEIVINYPNITVEGGVVPAIIRKTWNRNFKDAFNREGYEETFRMAKILARCSRTIGLLKKDEKYDTWEKVYNRHVYQHDEKHATLRRDSWIIGNAILTAVQGDRTLFRHGSHEGRMETEFRCRYCPYPPGVNVPSYYVLTERKQLKGGQTEEAPFIATYSKCRRYGNDDNYKSLLTFPPRRLWAALANVMFKEIVDSTNNRMMHIGASNIASDHHHPTRAIQFASEGDRGAVVHMRAQFRASVTQVLLNKEPTTVWDDFLKTALFFSD